VNTQQGPLTDGPILPWEAQPYKLWSLLDMMRFYAATFVLCTTNLERALQHFIATGTLVGGDEAEIQAEMAAVLTELLAAHEEVGRLPVSSSLRAQFKRAIDQVRVARSEHEVPIIATLCNEIKNNLIMELTEHLFLFVPPQRRWFYLEPEKWFGPASVARFPGVEREVRDACQCLALEQWTAAVFHAMRLLERGPLRAMAQELQVLPAEDAQLQNWHPVIQRIENKVEELQNRQNKTQADKESLRHYSEAAVQLRYFKDAWRNHVSHSREPYDEQQATAVLNAVKSFMAAMAKDLPLKEERK
jgi:hypothetical protein